MIELASARGHFRRIYPQVRLSVERTFMCEPTCFSRWSSVKYYDIILTHTNDLHAQAEAAGAGGVPFEYIALEFDLFINKVKDGIDCI